MKGEGWIFGSGYTKDYIDEAIHRLKEGEVVGSGPVVESTNRAEDDAG